MKNIVAISLATHNATPYNICKNGIIQNDTTQYGNLGENDTYDNKH